MLSLYYSHQVQVVLVQMQQYTQQWETYLLNYFLNSKTSLYLELYKYSYFLFLVVVQRQ